MVGLVVVWDTFYFGHLKRRTSNDFLDLNIYFFIMLIILDACYFLSFRFMLNSGLYKVFK
jgi:hypothetical protein